MSEREPDGETEHGDAVYLHTSKKYRLRPLISDATKGEKMAGLTIEGTGNLKDYLIITCDWNTTPPSMIQAAFKVFREKLDQPVLIIPDTWELCVFEPVDEETFKAGDWVRHPDGIGRVESIVEGVVQVRRWLADGFGGYQSWRQERLSHAATPEWPPCAICGEPVVVTLNRAHNDIGEPVHKGCVR